MDVSTHYPTLANKFPRFASISWVHLGIIVTSLVGAGLFLYGTSYGSLMNSSDSARYIAAGRSFLQGQGFLDIHALPFNEWPPLYPIVIAALTWLTRAPLNNADILEPLRLLNAVTFGLTLYSLGLLLVRYLRSAYLVFAGLIAALATWNLWLIHYYAWSEPLFCLFVLVFLLLIPQVLETNSIRSILLFSLVTALACLQRYSGMALIAAGVGALLLLSRPTIPVLRRLIKAAVYALLSSIPLGIWIAYNAARVTGDPTGRDVVAVTDERIQLIANDGLDALNQFYLRGVPLPWCFGLATLTVVLALLALLWLRHRREATSFWRQLHAITFVIVSYVGFTAVAMLTTRIDLSSRMFAPPQLPALLMLLVLVDRGATALALRLNPGRKVHTVTAGLLAVWIAVFIAPKTYAEVTRLAQSCCRDNLWLDSPMIQYLKEHPLDGDLWTTSRPEVYLHTGHIVFNADNPGRYTRTPNAAQYLVDFDDSPSVPGALRRIAEAELIYQTADAGLFRLTFHEDAPGSE